MNKHIITVVRIENERFGFENIDAALDLYRLIAGALPLQLRDTSRFYRCVDPQLTLQQVDAAAIEGIEDDAEFDVFANAAEAISDASRQ